MKAWVARQEEDGLWHIHCTQCMIDGRVRSGWCMGKYTDRVAALSNAAAHMRSRHGVTLGPEW